MDSDTARMHRKLQRTRLTIQTRPPSKKGPAARACSESPGVLLYEMHWHDMIVERHCAKSGGSQDESGHTSCLVETGGVRTLLRPRNEVSSEDRHSRLSRETHGARRGYPLQMR